MSNFAPKRFFFFPLTPLDFGIGKLFGSQPSWEQELIIYSTFKFPKESHRVDIYTEGVLLRVERPTGLLAESTKFKDQNKQIKSTNSKLSSAFRPNKGLCACSCYLRCRLPMQRKDP